MLKKACKKGLGRWRWIAPLSLLFLFTSLPLWAADFHVGTTLLGQVRQNQHEQTEVPINGYLHFGGSQGKGWNISGQTDMRFFGDPSVGQSDFDLYQALLHFEPTGNFAVDFGRQFVNQGFNTAIIDGIKFTIFPAKHLDISLYTGIPRSVEIGDFNKNDGLLTGLSFGMRNVANTSARFHIAWRKNDITVSNSRVNDEVYIGLDVTHKFGGPVKPVVYALFEYDITANLVDTGTFGLDLYPNRRISLNFEFNYFNVNRRTNRPSIFGLYTSGRLLTANFSSTFVAVPDLMDIVLIYGYQNVEPIPSQHKSGNLVSVAFPFTFESIGLYFQPEYYFMNSFGGDVHGVRGHLHEDFTDRIYADLFVDFSTYNKITNDNDNAFSTVLWAGYEIFEGFKFSMGFEFNKNNQFDSDIRGTLKIDYHYDTKS